MKSQASVTQGFKVNKTSHTTTLRNIAHVIKFWKHLKPSKSGKQQKQLNMFTNFTKKLKLLINIALKFTVLETILKS